MEGSGRNPIVIFMIRKNLTAAHNCCHGLHFAGSNAMAPQARISEYAESGTDQALSTAQRSMGAGRSILLKPATRRDQV
jgi:hypothetical protein